MDIKDIKNVGEMREHRKYFGHLICLSSTFDEAYCINDHVVDAVFACLSDHILNGK